MRKKVKSICSVDNKLQKKLKNAKTPKQRKKIRSELRKVHNQYRKATNEQKELEKLLKKHGN